jgi:hypothetical protein
MLKASSSTHLVSATVYMIKNSILTDRNTRIGKAAEGGGNLSYGKALVSGAVLHANLREIPSRIYWSQEPPAFGRVVKIHPDFIGVCSHTGP